MRMLAVPRNATQIVLASAKTVTCVSWGDREREREREREEGGGRGVRARVREGAGEKVIL